METYGGVRYKRLYVHSEIFPPLYNFTRKFVINKLQYQIVTEFQEKT